MPSNACLGKLGRSSCGAPLALAPSLHTPSYPLPPHTPTFHTITPHTPTFHTQPPHTSSFHTQPPHTFPSVCRPFCYSIVCFYTRKCRAGSFPPGAGGFSCDSRKCSAYSSSCSQRPQARIVEQCQCHRSKQLPLGLQAVPQRAALAAPRSLLLPPPPPLPGAPAAHRPLPDPCVRLLCLGWRVRRHA